MTNNNIPESTKQAFEEFVERAGLCRPAEWYLERVTENYEKNPHGFTGLYNLKKYGKEDLSSEYHEYDDYVGPLTPFLKVVENVLNLEVYQHGYDSPFCDEVRQQDEYDRARLVCLDAWRKADHEAFRKYEHDSGSHIRFGDEEVTVDPRRVDVEVAEQIAEILHRWITQAIPKMVSTENLPGLPIWEFSHPVREVLGLIADCFSFQPTREEADMWMYAYYSGDERILTELRLIDKCLSRKAESESALSDSFGDGDRNSSEWHSLVGKLEDEHREELFSHINKIRSLLGFEDVVTARTRINGDRWKKILSRAEG